MNNIVKSYVDSERVVCAKRFRLLSLTCNIRSVLKEF